MKGKKTIVVLAMLLSLSIPAAFSGETFAVDYHFTPAEGGCGTWMIEGAFLQALPGEPMVPYYPASILLPQDAVVKDVKVKTGAPVVQTGIDITWGQPPCTFSDEPVKVARNEEIYGSDTDYPNKLFDVVSVGSFRGFQILNVNLYPVQYKPKSGTVKFYETMTVEVQFGKGMKNKLYRGLYGDKATAAGIVDNPEALGTYEDGPSPSQTEQYIIITNDTMQSTFQELANWKANFVTGTGVYTVSWITSNYTGVDNAEKVRNFIIDMYTNHGTLYVLLGGDIAAVPYRGFYIYAGGYTDYDMLADMYFAHLDGTFNDDGDSYWAEPGEVDWYAEIAVGRASCENTTEAQNFVNKVIAYEQAAKPERALLHQSRVASNNNPDARCLAWNCDDYLPPSYYKDYLFEEDGGVTKQMWIDHWAMDAIVCAHIGHGSATSYYINYQVTYGYVTWYTSDVASMTNTFWPWTTSVACISGQIEYNDCLAEAYVKDPDNGAIAAIYNDNYGWYMTNNACALSGEYCEMEFKACWQDGYEKFGEMLNQARSYMVSAASSDPYYRWCFYERNIVGDPESPSLTQRVIGDTVTITNPSDGETVSGTVNITVSASGCIDTVEFYIDSTLKYTDSTAPFEYSWDTTQYADGDHTIEVKGYCSGVYKDNDIITVTVSNEVPPSVTITYPYNGDTISGVVTVTTDTAGVDEVRFYVNNDLKHTDYTEPFTWDWDTTQYKNRGGYKLKAEGYKNSVFGDDDEIRVKINNPSIALLSFLVFFLPIGIYWKRR
jgi:hypothetical protein